MSTYHFVASGGAPPSDDVCAAMEKFGALPAPALQALLGTVLAFVAREATQNELQTQLEDISDEHGVNLNALKSILRALLFFLRGAVRGNLSPTYFRDDLITFGIAADKANACAALWKKRLMALSRAAAAETLMVNELVDIEWKFGVTAGSSEAERVGNVFLQLKLTLDNGSGNLQKVPLELSLPQFYNFMREMEKAKLNMEFFAS